MINYERPLVVVSEDVVEGVYLASGCFTATARITQYPETGRMNYVIQVDAQHQSNHNSNNQELTITFNQPVKCTAVDGQGGTIVSNNSATLVLRYTYFSNWTQSIGFGNLTVEAGAGLAILTVSLDDLDH